MTLEEIQALFRQNRGKAGCRASGTLTIGGKAIKGWELLECRPDGSVIIERVFDETKHRLTYAH